MLIIPLNLDSVLLFLYNSKLAYYKVISITERRTMPDTKTIEKKTPWRCRDGAVVRALASHQCGPGFDFQIRRHMWAEFVGVLLCTERFSAGTPVYPLLKNQHLT